MCVSRELVSNSLASCFPEVAKKPCNSAGHTVHSVHGHMGNDFNSLVAAQVWPGQKLFVPRLKTSKPNFNILYKLIN